MSSVPALPAAAKPSSRSVQAERVLPTAAVCCALTLALFFLACRIASVW
jgi:hypothetical protein